MTTPEPGLSPDITRLAAFLRTQWATERATANANAGACRNGHEGADNCRGLHTDPAGIAADLDTKEALLTDLLAEKHYVCDDPYYTCCAATRERDGDSCPGDEHHHLSNHCTCGLTERTTRRLHILAAPYADRPGYAEQWKP